jgi:uncharacterized protein involved in exopolysaccharide biosynthesis
MALRPDDDLDAQFIEPRQHGARPGLPVDYGRLWLSVRRDWRWLPIAGGVWLVLGIAVSLLFIGHTFKSEAILVWEPKTAGADNRILSTDAGSLKLPGALRQVKQRLKLKSPIDALGKQIDVWFDTGSNLVTVNANGPTAADSVLLTNTVIGVFLDQQRDLARVRAEEAVNALEKDLGVTQGRLKHARDTFDKFRIDNGVSDIDHETQLAIDNLSRLRQEQQTANGDARALAARFTELSTQVKKQPRTSVQSASMVNPEAEKLGQLRAELATAKARYTSEHPRIASLEAQISELQARVAKHQSVVSATVSGLNPEYEAASTSLSATRVEQEAAAKRISSYEEFVRAADERVSKLGALQGQAHSMQADIKQAETRIEELETQLSGARDAMRTPQIEWRVLTPAVEPEWPERSKRRAIVAGMPLAGMLVALLALLLRPVLNGRVFTAREAGYWANLPVIGSSAWPRNSEMFFTLVDELGDQGSAARGYTLVLGATGREKQLAEELAYWLGGGALSGRNREQAQTARVEVPTAHASPAGATGAEMQLVAQHGGGAATVLESEAIVPVQRQVGVALSPYPEGTHAWLGATEGPALRRAARMADRVIVLLTSGAELFTAVSGLRTRLGRDTGVGLVLLGLSPELLKLPDRVGDVEGFWRQAQARARAH